jgi:hypothetical protein
MIRNLIDGKVYLFLIMIKVIFLKEDHDKI